MRRPLALLAAGILWAGCGEGGDNDEELVSRLPGDARALSVIDLAAVKERLGLPEDADPIRPPGDGGEAQARLFAYPAARSPTSRASTAPSWRPSTRAE